MASNEKEGIINAAIQRGLSQVIEKHPRFREQESYLLKHLNNERVSQEIDYIGAYIQDEERRKGAELSDEDKSIITYQMFMNSAASGKFFDNAGKEVILRQSLEERARKGPRIRESREVLKGEQYLDNALVAFKDLYELMKTGDYAHHMPELAKAVNTVYNLGFLSSSVDLLKHYGFLNDKRYEMLKENIQRKAKTSISETQRAIENYSAPEPKEESKGKKLGEYASRAASIILAIAGASFLFSSSSLTGNVTGISLNNSLSLLGMSSLAVGVALFLATIKKEKK